MTARSRRAGHTPGAPGSPPRWSPGSKSAAGSSRSAASRVWFTIGRGALNEVYYPRVDSPCTRDLALLVTGPGGFYSDERSDAEHRVDWLEPGVPAFVLTNTCRAGRYQLEKTVVADDRLDVVLQRIRFVPLRGDREGYRIFALLHPHLGSRGAGNTAWVGEFKGQPMLFARRGGFALALACDRPFPARSAGFAGASDGVEDLVREGRLARCHRRAERGNVALMAELDFGEEGVLTLALGFGADFSEAAGQARASLQGGFERAKDQYVAAWRGWQDTLLPLDSAAGQGRDLYRASTATLLAHTNKSIAGAVASLTIPWGDHRGDGDLEHGAYHLIWSRDLAQHGGALLAAGAVREARSLLAYLAATQEADGHWPQNMWVSGKAFWDGVQLDQVAQPVLLADLALRHGALGTADKPTLWEMIRGAAGFIAREGPATELERWEEEGGYNAHALGSMVAAMLTAAEWADEAGDREFGASLRERADDWNARVEGWLYVRDTPLARRVGVSGYYARVLPAGSVAWPDPWQEAARVSPDAPELGGTPASEVVSVDVLGLVRFGLRPPDDPRVVDTLRVVDSLLRLDLPAGPIWRRHNIDRFGEAEDGSPYESGKGIGRAWPLLVGERAHYELAAGRPDRAASLLGVMAGFAHESGMIPEQVWDAPDLPERGLRRGRPTGAAMPLIWAHSEYIKLRRSLRDGSVFDLPPQPARRYLGVGSIRRK